MTTTPLDIDTRRFSTTSVESHQSRVWSGGSAKSDGSHGSLLALKHSRVTTPRSVKLFGGIGPNSDGDTTSEVSSNDSAWDDQRALRQNSNVHFGPCTLERTAPNLDCTAFGFECLKNCTIREITGVGCRALHNLTTGENNTAVGCDSLCSGTVQGEFDDNTALGHRSGMCTVSSGNTMVGSSAMLFNETGRENTVSGAFASVNNISGSRNTIAGFFAGYGVLEGEDNTIAGHCAQRATAAVSRVTVTGSGAARDNHSSDTTAYGYHSLHCNQTGEWNVGVGPYTLENVVSGSGSTAIGHSALRNAWGNDNTIVGAFGMSKNTSTGSENTGTGTYVLQQCTGQRNCATGYKSQTSVLMGNNNVSDGYMTLSRCVGGSRNAVVGSMAGTNIVEGHSNVALGFGSGPQTDLQDTICLGTGARATQSGEWALASAQHPVLTCKQVGEGGDASDLPGPPQLYLSVLVNGERYLLPLYKPPV